MDFTHIKVGDRVTRMLAGVVPMNLTVSEVDDHMIYCGPWTFSRKNGWEIDSEIGWNDVSYTGSHLILPTVKED